MSASLFTVQPEQLKALWPQLEPKIKKALTHEPAWDSLDIAEQVLKGTAQVWGSWDEEIKAVCVTSISIYHKCKVCNVLACGGEGLETITHYKKNVEDWALENGCALIRIYGRKGWKKVLPDYQETAIVLEKRLNG